MIGVHQGDCDAINDMGLIHRKGNDPLSWHAHVLDQQCCCDGAAEDHAAAEGPVQPCRASLEVHTACHVSSIM